MFIKEKFIREEVIKNIGLEEIIGTPLMESVYILKGNTMEDGKLHRYIEGRAWYILRGKVKIISYFEDGRDFFWELEEGEWFGIENAVLKSEVYSDIDSYSEAVVLEVPLGEIIESEKTSKKLLKKIIQIMSLSAKHREEKGALRIGYNDELYFLKYLEKHNFGISYNSIKDLSEVLNINRRTFQRILKRLSCKGILQKTKNRIMVDNMEAFTRYLEN